MYAQHEQEDSDTSELTWFKMNAYYDALSDRAEFLGSAYDEGYREGYRKGLEEARRKRREDAYKAGYTIGYNGIIRETAQKLLAMGLTIADVVKITELTEEEVRALRG